MSAPELNAAVSTEKSGLTQLPEPYIADPAVEAQEHWLLRRMDWELIERAVDRCKKGDSFNPSWTSFLAGLAVTALIACVTAKLRSTVQVFFLAVTILATLCSFLIYKVEERGRKNREDFLDALKEELEAAKKYMSKKIV